jgi:hypothetical protein
MVQILIVSIVLAVVIATVVVIDGKIQIDKIYKSLSKTAEELEELADADID